MSDDKPEAREVLKAMCWELATEGDRFFPPDETAEECINQWEDAPGEVDDHFRGVEHGQHSRAWTMATYYFSQIEKTGYDPKALAKEYAEDRGLPELDWGWLTHE